MNISEISKSEKAHRLIRPRNATTRRCEIDKENKSLLHV